MEDEGKWVYNFGMNAADRIRLIRLIADELAKYEYSDIDLILGQFDLPISDQWSGEKRDYVIHMTQHCADESLMALSSFIEDEVGKRVIHGSLTKSVEQCWEQGTIRLFISHSSEQKSEVGELKKILALFKVACFVAHDDIVTSEEWEKELLSGLDSCHAVVAWVTEDFNTSAYAQQEMGIALIKQKPVIPICKQEKPKGFLAKFQGSPDGGIEQIAFRIIEVLTGNSKTRKLMRMALLEALENSYSFEDAKKKMSLLEKCGDWEKDELLRLKKIKEENSQVAHAWGVPEQIDQLLNKYLPKEQQTVTVADLPF